MQVRDLRRPSTRSLVMWMLLAVAGVALLAYWDEQRENAAALRDFGHDQALLAQTLSHALASQLEVASRDAREASSGLVAPAERDGPDGVHVSARSTSEPPLATNEPGIFRFPAEEGDRQRSASVPYARLFRSLRALERPASLLVLVRPPGMGWIRASDGKTVTPTVLVPATAGAVEIPRKEAADLGLPFRMTIAGVAPVDAGRLGTWDVAVIASARVERDREVRAQRRLFLGVAVAGALVLAFGTAALRRQKHELELTHALAITGLERERDQRLVEARQLATMAALATGIAHEVATPLGVIVARAEQVASETGNGAPTRRAAEIIVEQSERIETVIRGFLALARGHSPRLELTAPADTARQALDLVEHRFAKAKVALTSELANGLPMVACDARMFEQVLVNLLLNACEACSPGGRVHLTLRVSGERVSFVVDDDGIGIDSEAARRATEPFFTTKPEGTGLGLAIANEIVNHHSGSLALEPRSEGGTRASVELPIASRPVV